jgi:Tfp pilus assembly protein PilE
MNTKKGATLIELLVVICVVVILTGILLTSVSKAFRRCKAWIWGAYAHNENRLNAYLDDNSSEKLLLMHSTNKVHPWVWIGTNADGSIKILK